MNAGYSIDHLMHRIPRNCGLNMSSKARCHQILSNNIPREVATKAWVMLIGIVCVANMYGYQALRKFSPKIIVTWNQTDSVLG